MKKHFFAFICVFVILFNTLSFKETHAMDIGVAIDVGSDILYQGWDMINSILNGAIISFSPYTQYADKAAAMGAFYNDWGNILEQLTGGTLDQEAAITFGDTTYPLDYGMSYNTMNYFVDEYGRILDQSPADPYYFPMLISPETYAAWNRYQNSWIGKYINAFTPDIPAPNPQPDYIPLLNCVNSLQSNGFWWKNLNVGGTAVITNWTFNYYANQHSFYSLGLFTNTPWDASQQMCMTPNIVDINVYSYNDVYAINQTLTFLNDAVTINGSPRSAFSLSAQDNLKNNISMNPSNNGIMLGSNRTGANLTLEFNGSLTDAITYISQRVRNVNIYVDGELWSASGGYIIPDPPVLAPDVIRIGDDGPVLRNDVFVPEQDLYVDLIGWTNLVDDKILDGDTIGFDDLIDAGVLTDAEGNIITDENRDEYFKKRDIASVITDELVDADLDNLLPPAPSPPDDDPSNWHFPTIVIPEGGDPDPKHTGISVLARIVNVTNLSMPAEVMTMFWGICITLIILGFIKILHK